MNREIKMPKKIYNKIYTNKYTNTHSFPMSRIHSRVIRDCIDKMNERY